MAVLQLFFLSTHQHSARYSTRAAGGRGRHLESHPRGCTWQQGERNWGVGGKGEDAGCPEQPPPNVHFDDLLMRIMCERALHNAWP